MAVQFIEPKPDRSLAKLIVASVMVHILESPFWLLGASWDDFPTGRKPSLMIVGNVDMHDRTLVEEQDPNCTQFGKKEVGWRQLLVEVVRPQ